MPSIYIRTDQSGPHAVCQWKDEPPPVGESARWELIAQTDDFDLAVRTFTAVKAKLQTDRRPRSPQR